MRFSFRNEMKVPRRVRAVKDTGRVVESRPFFHATVPLPPESGFEQRPARTMPMEVRGNSIKLLRWPTLLPGGIVIHEGGLHASTFRLDDFSQSTRYIRRRLRDGLPEYVLPKDWPKSTARNAEAIFLDNEYVDEYGHFLLETFSRLWPLLEDSSWAKLPIVTSAKNPARINFFYSKLGLPSPEVIRLTEATRLKRLWVFSQSFVLGKGFTPEAAPLYSRIASLGKSSANNGPKKVYLTRRGLSTRTGRVLKNEEDLEGVFSKRGFAIIAPQELRLEQQIQLYANCEFLAGQTGTGMYNRVFQPPDSRGLLLGASGYILNEHAYVREMMGLPQEIVVNGKSLHPEKHPQSADWEISVDIVNERLNS